MNVAHCIRLFQPLMPLWQDRQLAIVQGVGYPQPNLSHFRSIEIWDTASRSDQYLREGWLTRAFAQSPVPSGFAADSVVIGSAEMGPLGGTARATTLVSQLPNVFASQSMARASLRKDNARFPFPPGVGNDVVGSQGFLGSCDDLIHLKTTFPPEFSGIQSGLR